MVSINTDVIKSVNFLLKIWLALLFMIGTGILCGATEIMTINNLYLGTLASVGYFYIYLVQIVVQVLGEKIPPIMDTLTCVMGVIFNFACGVTLLANSNPKFQTDAGYAYAAFNIIVALSGAVEAFFLLKNMRSTTSN